MLLGNVYTTKEKGRAGWGHHSTYFSWKKEKEVDTKLKSKTHNNDTKPREENFYAKLTPTLCSSLRCKRPIGNSQRAP